ncbi:putative G-protein coupled receptors family 1 profile domain-containing protein [Seiridium cardinale]|uniref:G-protein coupled receptors family 1 profile domain-containing protein n=1 Tax=Seiridium cardinale TaxID=138064 RepID=A0ABR2XXU0_9PEZI
MASQVESAVLLLEIRQDDTIQRQNSTNLTDNQVIALEAVSLSFATISVFSAFVAFYWFVRMRRSFRQDLIMLLIQSDMMKAFWLMISPIIYFVSGPDGPINTNSTYCQISGFFLTTAVEASDISVLMIAIHSALYILRSQRSGGQSGLHPYRWYAYTIWLAVPLILAAVIPITGARFEDNGPFCYLPLQNSVYRTYLSWVPRYIIFGVIFLVYAFLYVYIAWRFRRLRKDQRRFSFQSTSSPVSDRRTRGAQGQVPPPTPPLAYHGLLDTSSIRNREDGQRSRQHSVTSEVSTLKSNDNGHISHSLQQPGPRRGTFPWKWMKINRKGAPEPYQQHDEISSTLPSPTTASLPVETPELPAPPAVHASHAGISTAETIQSTTPSFRQPLRKPIWRQSLYSDNGTATDSGPPIHSMLQEGPHSGDEVPDSSAPSLFLPLSATEDTLRKSRDKMNRQLRLLFVYPAIYVVAWIAPFISQVYRLENSSSEGMPQPYGVFIVSIASLCIGAAVDCCFYSAWEKPWRHMKCGFWEGLATRLKLKHRNDKGGRSKDEERRDATAALDRRNVERADREAAALERARIARAPREWWDLEEDEESA